MKFTCSCLFKKAFNHRKLSYIAGGLFIEGVLMGGFTVLLHFKQVEL